MQFPDRYHTQNKTKVYIFSITIHHCHSIPNSPPPLKQIGTFQLLRKFSKFDFKLIGESSFMSDNISTISILKDFLTREATKKKIQLEMSCKVIFLDNLFLGKE